MNRINLPYPFAGEEMKAQKTCSHDCNSGKRMAVSSLLCKIYPLYLVFYVNSNPWNCTAGGIVEVITNPGLLSFSFVYLFLIRDSCIGTIHPVIFLLLQKSNCFVLDSFLLTLQLALAMRNTIIAPIQGQKHDVSLSQQLRGKSIYFQ